MRLSDEEVRKRYGRLNPIVAVVRRSEGPEALQVFRNPREAAQRDYEGMEVEYLSTGQEAISGPMDADDLELELTRQSSALHRQQEDLVRLNQRLGDHRRALRGHQEMLQTVRMVLKMGLSPESSVEEALRLLESSGPQLSKGGDDGGA